MVRRKKTPVRRPARAVTRTGGRRLYKNPPPKRSYSRPRKAPPVITETHRQLAQYANPFLNATRSPKIPDGKLSTSLGFTSQIVKEVAIMNQDSPSSLFSYGQLGTLHMIFFPGKNTPLVIANTVEAQTNSVETFPVSDINEQVLVPRYGSHAAFSNTVTGTAAANYTGLLTPKEKYAYWRVVSQGLRISCLNTDDENDGWWEAIRLNEALDTDQYSLQCTNNVNSTSNAAIVPTGHLTNNMDRDLTSNRSYTTGTMKDLHKHIFQLHPVSDDHDVTQDVGETLVQPGDCAEVNSGTAAKRYIRFASGRDNLRSCISSEIDNSYDCIYLRIHGRLTGNPTKLHVNVKCNQEVVYGTTESEARFMTQTADTGRAVERTRQAIRNRSGGRAGERIQP